MPGPANLTANSAKEIVWAVKESPALGTPIASPVPTVDSVYPRLSQGQFGVDDEPILEDIMSGAGYSVLVEKVSDHYECKGPLKINLYPSQFLFWMNFCTGRVSLDQTLPWPTDQLPGDLPSLSFYHNFRDEVGTRVIERLAGTKCAAWTIEMSRKSTTATLAMDLVACRKYPDPADGGSAPTDFVYPADTDYPLGPFTYAMTGGRLIIANGGTARVGYDSLSISGKNTLDPQWFEQPHLLSLACCGRTTTLDADLRLVATPDDKTAFQSITTQAASVAWVTGGKTYTIDFHGRNYITKLPRNMPASGTFTRKLSLANAYDNTAGNDFTFSVV